MSDDGPAVSIVNASEPTKARPARRPASFGRDTLQYGAAIFADRLTGLFMLPLLTSGLDKRDFGAWSQIQSAYGFFSTALLLGFMHTVSGLVAGRSPREVSRIYSGIVLVVLLSTTTLAALFVLWPDVASRILFGDESYRYVLGAVAWFAATEAFYELAVLAFLRAECKIAVGSLLHGSKAMLRLLAAWWGVRTGDPLVAILFVLGATNVVMVSYVLARHIFPHGIASPTRLGWDFWRVSLIGATSTAATVLLGWANLSVNRFLIVHFEGLREVAVYSANYSIITIVALPPMILTFTLLHHLSGKLATGALDHARGVLERSMTYYVYATLPILVLVAIFYRQLLALLAPRGYDAGVVLPASLMAFFFGFGLEQLLVFSTFSSGSTNALRARLIALGLNVVGGVILIPAVGLAGAAVPPLAGTLIVVLICTATLRARLGYCFPWRDSLSIGGAAIVMAVVGWLVVNGFDIRGWWTIGISWLALGAIYLSAESLRSTSLTRDLVADLTRSARQATPTSERYQN